MRKNKRTNIRRVKRIKKRTNRRGGMSSRLKSVGRSFEKGFGKINEKRKVLTKKSIDAKDKIVEKANLALNKLASALQNIFEPVIKKLVQIFFSLISKLINIKFVNDLLNKIKNEKRIEIFTKAIDGIKKYINDQINSLFNSEISKLQEEKYKFIENYINPLLKPIPANSIIRRTLCELIQNKILKPLYLSVVITPINFKIKTFIQKYVVFSEKLTSIKTFNNILKINIKGDDLAFGLDTSEVDKEVLDTLKVTDSDILEFLNVFRVDPNGIENAFILLSLKQVKILCEKDEGKAIWEFKERKKVEQSIEDVTTIVKQIKTKVDSLNCKEINNTAVKGGYRKRRNKRLTKRRLTKRTRMKRR